MNDPNRTQTTSGMRTSTSTTTRRPASSGGHGTGGTSTPLHEASMTAGALLQDHGTDPNAGLGAQ